MSPADIVTLATFLGVVFAGVIGSMLVDARRAQPEVRIRARLRELQARQAVQASADPAAAELFRLRTPDGWLDAQIRHHRQRLATVGGKHATRWLALAALVGFLLSLVTIRMPWVQGPMAALEPISLPVTAVVLTYRAMNRRFRERFLKAFPDTLDMVIRAVRAGVPVTHAIASAAEQADEPVATEFRIMGDALKLGIDVVEVLEAANARIEIADFSFFSVCLRLQRETGGQIGETLENLAAIVRARREVQMKSHALTAEGRMTSKFIAAVPFAITGVLYLMDPSYVLPLFTTPLGHELLALAGVMLVVGLVVVTKMAKLGESR